MYHHWTRTVFLIPLLSTAVQMMAQNYNFTRTDPYHDCETNEVVLTTNGLIVYVGNCETPIPNTENMVYYAAYDKQGNLVHSATITELVSDIYWVDHVYALPDGGIFIEGDSGYCNPFDPVDINYYTRFAVRIKPDWNVLAITTGGKGIWASGHGVTPAGEPYVLDNYGLQILTDEIEHYLPWTQIGAATMISDTTLLATGDSTRLVNYLTGEVLYTVPRLFLAMYYLQTVSYEERTWLCRNDHTAPYQLYQDTVLIAEYDHPGHLLLDV